MNKWDELYAKGIKYKPLNNIFLNKLFDKIQTVTGKKPVTIIDIGCGSGESLLKFLQRGMAATGVDFSQVAIDRARNTLGDDAEP